jgi:hypothetical protein
MAIVKSNITGKTIPVKQVPGCSYRYTLDIFKSGDNRALGNVFGYDSETFDCHILYIDDEWRVLKTVTECGIEGRKFTRDITLCCYSTKAKAVETLRNLYNDYVDKMLSLKERGLL